MTNKVVRELTQKKGYTKSDGSKDDLVISLGSTAEYVTYEPPGENTDLPTDIDDVSNVEEALNYLNNAVQDAHAVATEDDLGEVKVDKTVDDNGTPVALTAKGHGAESSIDYYPSDSVNVDSEGSFNRTKYNLDIYQADNTTLADINGNTDFDTGTTIQIGGYQDAELGILKTEVSVTTENGTETETVIGTPVLEAYSELGTTEDAVKAGFEKSSHLSLKTVLEKVIEFFAPKKHSDYALDYKVVDDGEDSTEGGLFYHDYLETDEDASLYGVADHEKYGHVVIGDFLYEDEETESNLIPTNGSSVESVVPNIRSVDAYINYRENCLLENTFSDGRKNFVSMFEPDGTSWNNGDTWEELRPTSFQNSNTIYTRNYLLNATDQEKYEKIALPQKRLPLLTDAAAVYEEDYGNLELNLPLSVNHLMTLNLPEETNVLITNQSGTYSEQTYYFAIGARLVYPLETPASIINANSEEEIEDKTLYLIILKGLLGAGDNGSSSEDETEYQYYAEYVNYIQSGEAEFSRPWTRTVLVCLNPENNGTTEISAKESEESDS